MDPPGWWPDLTPFTDYEDTYIGMAMDLDCPYDSSGGPEPFVGDESACNKGYWDGTNNIAYQVGFGRTGEHPEYNNYHAGMALANGGEPGESEIPFATANIRNNQYLYPTSPWGWKDGELYQLAKGLTPAPQPGYVEWPDSIVDRSQVLTARHIAAGTDANMTASFTIIEAFSRNSLAELQSYVATGRSVVAAERLKGYPVKCGDANGDQNVNVGDVVYLVGYLYRGGPLPVCPANRGDVNNDGVTNVGDVVYLVGFLYRGGPDPICPGIWY
jgi:hypothetical protein